MSTKIYLVADLSKLQMHTTVVLSNTSRSADLPLGDTRLLGVDGLGEGCEDGLE